MTKSSRDQDKTENLKTERRQVGQRKERGQNGDRNGTEIGKNMDSGQK